MSKLMRLGTLALSTAILLTTHLSAQSFDRTQLVGKWKMNLAKSQLQNVPRPMQSIFVVSEASAKRFKWEVTTVLPHGEKSIMGFDGAIDGKPYAYKGAERGTKIRFEEANGSLVGDATYPGGGTLHQEVALSEDRNTMTAHCSMTFNSPTVTWTEVWERVVDKNGK